MCCAARCRLCAPPSNSSRHYRPHPPLSCPITAIGGTADPFTSRTMLEGWAAQTTAAFDLRIVAGNHFVVDDEKGAIADVCRGAMTAGL